MIARTAPATHRTYRFELHIATLIGCRLRGAWFDYWSDGWHCRQIHCAKTPKLGAYVIDADKLGHRAYVKGTDAFHKVVASLAKMSGADGEVDRRP